MGFGYIFGRIARMNFAQLIAKMREVHSKSRKSFVSIAFDMVVCAVKYKAGYMDYALFEMYNLNKAQRKTVVTRGINNDLIRQFNDPAYNNIFDNKIEFAKRFSEFIRRDWLEIKNATEEDVLSFADRHPVFFAKPAQGMCGKGIEKITVGEFHRDRLYAYLTEHDFDILEEIVVQHPKMLRLHPYSVNTCRVITLYKKGETHIVAAYLRIGNGKHVDNFNSGGMVVPIEADTGNVVYPALDKSGKLYYKHPVSHMKISGFKVPLWGKVIKLAKEAGSVIPQVGLVGWDIAVCDTHPLLIEGNNFPGHDIYGLPAHRRNGVGMLPKFRKIIDGQ